MFSLDGSKNIRNILTISFISLLLLSVFIFSKYAVKINSSFETKCQTFYDILNRLPNTNEDYSIISSFSEVIKVCNKLKIYESEEFQTSMYYFSFDLDSNTYFNNFLRLNTLNYATKKSLIESGKSINEYKNLKEKFKISGLSEFNFFKDSSFKLFDDYEKLFFVAEKNKQSIKNRFVVSAYSSAYTNIFDNNKYAFHFIIFNNFVVLLFLLFFFYKILRILFPLVSKKLLILIISNIIMVPYFWVYFLSLYKEPFILLSITSIVVNYLYFLTKKINILKFICFTFFLVIAFNTIRYVKYDYFIIFISSFLLSILQLTIYKKNINNFFIGCFQLILILIFSSSIHPSNDKVVFFNSNVHQIIFAEKKKNNIVFADKERNNIVFADKEKNNIFNPIHQIKKNIKNIQVNINKDSSYFVSEIDQEKKNKYQELECFKFVNKSFCQKINNFIFRIYRIKNATLWENKTFDKYSHKNNENIINDKSYSSATEIIKQIPISAIKSNFMPVLFNSSKLVSTISVLKIISSFLFLYCFYSIYKNRSIKDFQAIFGIVIIFLPLTIATDLVTSNYFTYLRYLYPFNIFMALILFSFVINKIVKMKND